MSNKTSQHILSTSANLLGFGLFVITSLHISNKSEVTFIDDFATIVTILLAFSCLFSFFAIKSEKEKRKRKRIAKKKEPKKPEKPKEEEKEKKKEKKIKKPSVIFSGKVYVLNGCGVIRLLPDLLAHF